MNLLSLFLKLLCLAAPVFSILCADETFIKPASYSEHVLIESFAVITSEN